MSAEYCAACSRRRRAAGPRGRGSRPPRRLAAIHDADGGRCRRYRSRPRPTSSRPARWAACSMREASPRCARNWSAAAPTTSSPAATPRTALLLDARHPYVPDYVANAGGIINVAAEYLGWSEAEVTASICASGAHVLKYAPLRSGSRSTPFSLRPDPNDNQSWRFSPDSQCLRGPCQDDPAADPQHRQRADHGKQIWGTSSFGMAASSSRPSLCAAARRLLGEMQPDIVHLHDQRHGTIDADR
jgi:hypothetical protein